jgi:hypothetical protein
MPVFVWILIWAAVLLTLTVMVVRQKRSGRQGPAEVERFKHGAVQEAGVNLDARGPNGQSQTWGA